MKKRTIAPYEVLLAVFFVVLFLLTQLIRTTTVQDETSGIDEDGLPTTSLTLKDIEAPGTRIAVPMVPEWETALQKRFPDAEIVRYDDLPSAYMAVASGEAGAAFGFIEERRTLANTNPDLAFIMEPFAVIDCGFATQKTEVEKASHCLMRSAKQLKI
ncbi:MAG: transporter substrate-binding domain-containing protein [Clostridia bacterium]|nr:transporter substrate-binding domain-containing protein [Clostridia bacterium]